jgi:peptide methionine sulfoxide reductase MsrA
MSLPRRKPELRDPADEPAVLVDGCFRGRERSFWQSARVYSTAEGYAGEVTPNPTYEDVRSGRTDRAATGVPCPIGLGVPAEG